MSRPVGSKNLKTIEKERALRASILAELEAERNAKPSAAPSIEPAKPSSELAGVPIRTSPIAPEAVVSPFSPEPVQQPDPKPDPEPHPEPEPPKMSLDLDPPVNPIRERKVTSWVRPEPPPRPPRERRLDPKKAIDTRQPAKLKSPPTSKKLARPAATVPPRRPLGGVFYRR